MKTKVIAMYLPQFHQIPENDEFWGKGFTDWVTVRNATPVYAGHNQPRVPLNDNYYDLSQKKNVEWQAKLAHEAGIYGFGVYHYWFNNEKNLLTKPAEIIRDSANFPLKYFFVWDDNSWVRSWSNVAGNAWAPAADDTSKKTGPKVMVEFILGEEQDWENHYNYLRTHFKSPNYEKVNNKPIFGIISYKKGIEKMCHYLDELARRDGFDGLFFVFQRNRITTSFSWAYTYTYQPHYVSMSRKTFIQRLEGRVMKLLKLKKKEKLTFFNYDKVWSDLLKQSENDTEKSIINSGFVDYDDSPRRGSTRGTVFKGATPEKFKRYLKKLVNITESQGKEYLFLTAWNEWGEGAYLEPDETNGSEYLNAVREVIKSSEDE